MDVKKYIVSNTSNANFVLKDGVVDGADSLKDAESYARDRAITEDRNMFIFEVDLKLVEYATLSKEVSFRYAPTEQATTNSCDS